MLSKFDPYSIEAARLHHGTMYVSQALAISRRHAPEFAKSSAQKNKGVARP
jgi:hypothetical protein